MGSLKLKSFSQFHQLSSFPNPSTLLARRAQAVRHGAKPKADSAFGPGGTHGLLPTGQVPSPVVAIDAQERRRLRLRLCLERHLRSAKLLLNPLPISHTRTGSSR